MTRLRHLPLQMTRRVALATPLALSLFLLPVPLHAQGEPVEKPRRVREIERGEETPTATPQPQPQLPPGKYRISVTGFTVNHQTEDDALQLDGKGDEVFLSVAVLEPTALGNVPRWHGRSRLAESAVIGDRNGFSTRIRGGSLSDQGGLQTGDVVRLPQPFVVWEGPMTTPIVVIPTIWEWDNGSMDRRGMHLAWIDRMRPPSGRALNDWAPHYREPSNFDYPTIKARGFQELTKADCSDCRIGTFDARAYGIFEDPMSGYNRPIAINMSSGFRPATISLSTKNLEPFLGAKNAAEFPVQYKDNGKGSGDYTIHLKFERIP